MTSTVSPLLSTSAPSKSISSTPFSTSKLLLGPLACVTLTGCFFVNLLPKLIAWARNFFNSLIWKQQAEAPKVTESVSTTPKQLKESEKPRDKTMQRIAMTATSAIAILAYSYFANNSVLPNIGFIGTVVVLSSGASVLVTNYIDKKRLEKQKSQALPSVSNVKTKIPKLTEAQTLTQVFQETKAAAQKGSYIIGTGPTQKTMYFHAELQAMQTGTKKYLNRNNIIDKIQTKIHSTPLACLFSAFQSKCNWDVQAMDTVEAGLDLKRNYNCKNVAIVNFANAHSPGGGVQTGCRAQEEEICRKTALYQSLTQPSLKRPTKDGPKYHVPKEGIFYSPSVPIIRERTSKPGKFPTFEWANSDKVETLNVITSAAIDLRRGPNGRTMTKQEVQKKMKTVEHKSNSKAKMEAQILSAIDNGQDGLVLGAFGCGAFQQTPQEVAKWYREVLEQKAPFSNKHYYQYFKHIRFAVLVVTPKDQENFDVFQQQFKTQPIP